MSLKNKTISGLKWSFTDSAMNQAVHFVFGVILARLLSPSEYGIIGMSMVFVALFEKIVDGGLEQALIRKQNCTEADYSTMFYTNIVVGLFSFVILYFSSGAIAAFYENSEIKLLVKIMAFNLIINSFGMVERAMLIRDIDFRRQTKINFFSSTSSGIVGILCALFGFGYWSLAVKTLWQNLSRVVMLHYSSEWRPKLMYSIQSFKELFGFGSKMLGASMLHSLYHNIYSLIIGKVYSPAQLGYYSRANQFKGFVSDTIVSSTQRVTYPVLSKLHDDNERLRASYKKITKLVFFISSFFLSLLFLNSREIILILLCEKWAPYIAYLQILCFGAIHYPIALINLNILKAKGRSDLYLKIEFFEKILWIPAIVIGVIYGMNALVCGAVFNSLITFFMNSMYSGKLIQYSAIRQLRDLMPLFFNNVVMTIIALIIGSFFKQNIYLSLMAKSFIATTYFVVSGNIFRIHEYMELKEIVFEQLKQLPYFNKIKSGESDV